MYGLIGKMRAKPGEREALIGYILESSGEMPGCLSYIVARDPDDADAIARVDAQRDFVEHKASLALPAVQAAIAKARPIIAGFDSHVVTQPVGGFGLDRG